VISSKNLLACGGIPLPLLPVLAGLTKFPPVLARCGGELWPIPAGYSTAEAPPLQVMGKWIAEMAELKGSHKGMIEDIKSLFSAEKDTIRQTYRRNSEDFFRRNVTIDTTSEDEYLRDDENRRFCPVPVTVQKNNVMDFKAFEKTVGQMWAEAEQMFVRNLVTATMLRVALSDNPIIRDVRQKDKVIGQALREMGGWKAVGPSTARRLGRVARWFFREGEDSQQEFVPREIVRANTGTSDDDEPSVDGLLD
jgi:hypothetical protein